MYLTHVADNTEISDQVLVQEIKNPATRNQAFNRLLDKYQRRVYWHIRRIVIDHDDTDDLVQNTFIRVWEHLDSFREDSKLYTWIYRIATNEALAFLQKKRTVSIEEVDNSLLEKLETTSYFNGDSAMRKLQEALLQLPEKQRVVFNLKYFDNMKYEDMAEMTNTSVGALKASYFHAVRKIEDFLKRPLNFNPDGLSN